MAQYNKVPELSVSSVFKLRPEELELFFYREHQQMPDNRGERRECLTILEKVDWRKGLLQSLVTDKETGIIGDSKDIQRRQKFFGENKRSLPSVRAFWWILWDQFDEVYMQVLFWLGIAMLVLCMFSSAITWVDSASILFAVLFAGLIQTFCDWGKEKQFLLLQEEIKNDKTNVLRGHMGTSQTIYNKDLVVGDIILLSQGDRVPADCILVAEMDMKVDQKAFFPDMEGSEMTSKQCSYENVDDDIQNNPDMLLLQDSMVMSGSGKAVVLAVGKHTLVEREIQAEVDKDKNALQIEKELTPFQQKLETLAAIIGTYAKLICLACIVLFGLVWFLHVVFTPGAKLIDQMSIKAGIDLACTVAALLAVCIPEGMPLVISMAMAFSVQALQEQNLLIKGLAALETSGQLHEVVTGKTATLTEGEMQVEVVHMQGKSHNARSLEVTQNVLNDLKEAIVLNTDAVMQMDATKYFPKGSPVEVGLLQFIVDQGVNVQDKFLDRENDEKFDLKAFIPFSSDRKVMTVAYIDLASPDDVKIIMKGAPEEIIARCNQTYDSFGNSSPIDQEETLRQIEEEVIMSKSEGQGQDDQPAGLKAISFASKTMSAADWQSGLDFEQEDNRNMLESDLCYIATTGLSDPLRDSVDSTIEKLNNTQTNVRLLSGDHKLAVLCMAVQLGMKDDIEDMEDVMAGPELLQLLKSKMDCVDDKEEGRGATWVFKTAECRSWFKKNIKKKVCFVYRATPELKHVFVAALRNSDSIVGVTGEGLGDARALSEANVGFSMGKDGCDAAKDHSDIIMMDDRFATLNAAIRFGRNIQDNVRKFVQFQLTVNLTCMTFVIPTVLIVGHSPLNVVQLLWLNLVMDVLAAIAFSTEQPDPELKSDRVTNKDKIITKPMMRQILFQSLYQLIVLLLIMYVAPIVGGYEYNLFSEKVQIAEVFTYRCLHQTFIFHCFIMMSLCNMLNCRFIDPIPVEMPQLDDNMTPEERQEIIDENREANAPTFNIFRRFWANWWFWIVFFLELNIQYFIVGYKTMGYFFATTPLTFGMHMCAIALGVGSILISQLVKVTGPKLVHAMPEFGEDAEALERSKSFSDSVRASVDVSPKDEDDEKHSALLNDSQSHQGSVQDDNDDNVGQLPDDEEDGELTQATRQ